MASSRFPNPDVSSDDAEVSFYSEQASGADVRLNQTATLFRPPSANTNQDWIKLVRKFFDSFYRVDDLKSLAQGVFQALHESAFQAAHHYQQREYVAAAVYMYERYHTILHPNPYAGTKQDPALQELLNNFTSSLGFPYQDYLAATHFNERMSDHRDIFNNNGIALFVVEGIEDFLDIYRPTHPEDTAAIINHIFTVLFNLPATENLSPTQRSYLQGIVQEFFGHEGTAPSPTP